MLLATIIEGPIVTAAGAFAASLGIFNLGLVILISFLGDIIGDTIYFYMGRFGRRPIIDKYGHRFGLKKARIRSIEKHLKNHFMKTLAVIKLTPLLAPPGIMIIGASKISFWKFWSKTMFIIIPASLFFAIIGYHFGLATDSFFKYYKIARWLLLFIIILVAGIAYLIEKNIFTKIAAKIEKI